MRKSRKDRILGKCKRFNGVQNKTCEAGVNYDQVRSTDVHRRSLPCLFDDTPDCVACDKREKFTEEEADAMIAEDNLRVNGMIAARKAIVEHLGGPWKKGTAGSSGTIDCPVCKTEKSLRFSRAGYNGHIHAHCLKGDCVSWME
jgi:hypothetical protein